MRFKIEKTTTTLTIAHTAAMTCSLVPPPLAGGRIIGRRGLLESA